ncbi:MAG: creatininase family protein [Deltaproteobacteria bacterium]|nr:creatininase family protein [Deltaproteobacteria bacterium]MBW1943095.1 creatininase family protein [Deltaproteobacteria bacterium]
MGYSIFDETMVDMAWPDIEKAARDKAIVILPIGVIEEHGPHMGLGVDAYCSYLVSKLTREGLEQRGVKTLIAPPFYWGINYATGSFPGSFTVRRETMKAMLYDILSCLIRWGFENVFIINWHGDHHHNMVIIESLREARTETGIRAYFILRALDARRFNLSGKEPHVIVQKDTRSPGPSSKYFEIHADSLETGIMQQYFPKQVNTKLSKKLKSTDLTRKDLMLWRQGWSDAKKLTPDGYFGDPAGFDPPQAKKFIQRHAGDIADLIEKYLKGEYKPPALE